MTILRNRYTSRVAVRDDDRIAIAAPGPQTSTATWQVEDVGDDSVRIRAADDPARCLHVEDGPLALGPVGDGWLSARWRVEPIGTTPWCRLRNVWRQDHVLHGETEAFATMAAGPVEDGWWSAMWALDEGLVADARSVHLNYPQEPCTSFHVAIDVVDAPPGTYLCAIGADGTYVGIQRLVDGTGQLIFSVWDGPRGDRASVEIRDPAFTEQRFEGEGEGVSLRAPTPWPPAGRVAFAMHCIASPTKPEDAYYWAQYAIAGDWSFIGGIARPSSPAPLRGLYSFVEDFRRNGANEGVAADERSPYQHHVADFVNPFARTDDGPWQPVREATFTAWSPQPLENIDARVTDATDEIGFRLATGGWWVPATELDKRLHSTASPGQAPGHLPAP